MFSLAREVICVNASITESEFLKQLSAMSGVEQHIAVAYQPQKNGRAEPVVQSIVNSVRQYLEQLRVSASTLGWKACHWPLGL